jgi:hypothetical protein
VGKITLLVSSLSTAPKIHHPSVTPRLPNLPLALSFSHFQLRWWRRSRPRRLNPLHHPLPLLFLQHRNRPHPLPITNHLLRGIRKPDLHPNLTPTPRRLRRMHRLSRTQRVFLELRRDAFSPVSSPSTTTTSSYAGSEAVAIAVSHRCTNAGCDGESITNPREPSRRRQRLARIRVPSTRGPWRRPEPPLLSLHLPRGPYPRTTRTRDDNGQLRQAGFLREEFTRNSPFIRARDRRSRCR